MEIKGLEQVYKKALGPVFGERFQILHERDDFVTVFLDGEREEFFFTLYGADHARLYWCNECFIFDRHRDQLTSSDTYGEIVYECPINPEKLPEMIVNLVLRLKDCVFIRKEETITGRLPSGYDDRKEYVVWAKREGFRERDSYRLGNLLVRYL